MATYLPDSFTFDVYNSYVTSQVATVTIDSIELPHQPTVTIAITNGFVGIPVTVPLSAMASDGYNDPLTITSLQSVTQGTAVFTSNSITYTPTNGAFYNVGEESGIITFTVSNKFEAATGEFVCVNYNRQMTLGPTNSSPQPGFPVLPTDTLPHAIAFANSFGPSLQWQITIPILLSNQVPLTIAGAATSNGDLSAIDITGNICLAPESYAGLPSWFPTNAVLEAAGSLPMRLFQIEPGAKLCLSNCALTGGSATLGGAIYNQGILDLVDSQATNNAATADGGAIYNLNGMVELTNSTITANTAIAGGGLYQLGDGGAASTMASNSIITGDFATNDLVSTNANSGTSAITSTSLTVGIQTAPSFGMLAPLFAANQNPVAAFAADYDPARFHFTVTPATPWNDASRLQVIGGGTEHYLELSPLEQTTQAPQTVAITLGNSNLSYTENISVEANSAAQLPPTANPDYASVNSFGTVSIPVLANDINPIGPQSQLSLVSVSGAQFGTVTIDGNNVDYVNNNNYTYNDSFTYVVTDGAMTATGTVYITLLDYFSYDPYIQTGADNGAGSLRAVLNYIGNNYASGGWQIALYSDIDLTSAGDNSAGPSAFAISQNVTINGYGATISLDPNASPMRFFHVLPGGSLTLVDVVLSGGIAGPSDYGAGKGGAIYNEGSLNLEGVAIVDCQAQNETSSPGLGGAIFNLGLAIVNDSQLTNNTASDGGGIYQWADGLAVTVCMTNSVLENPESSHDISATVTNAGSVSAIALNTVIQNAAAPSVGQMSDINIYQTHSVPVYVVQGTNTVTVTATSENPNVVPDSNLVFTGTNTLRQLAISPVNNGIANLLVQASIGSNSFSRGFALNVFGTNNLDPVLPDYVVSVYRGQALLLDVLANDYDLGNSPLQLVSVSPALDGSVSITNDQVLYANDGSDATNDLFTYVATNTYGGLATGRVLVTVQTPTIDVNSAQQQGPGSLTAAFNALRVQPGLPWTLRIDPSLAGQTVTLAQFTLGESGDYTAYDITNNVTIDGSGAPGFTLNVNNNPYLGEEMRHFRVEPGASLTLLDLTLSGGLSQWYSYSPDLAPGLSVFGGMGGSILNLGTINVTNVVFSDNYASGPAAAGGAIANQGGNATIAGSTFVNNTASGNSGNGALTSALPNSFGGAIFNYNGSLLLISNTFATNSAADGANVCNLGDGAAAALTMVAETMTNNTSGFDLTSRAINNGTSRIVSCQTNVLSQNAPSINTIADQTVGDIANVPFIFTPASSNAILSAASENTNVLPNANLEVSVQNGAANLRIVPGAQDGISAVAVQLADGALSYAQVFNVIATQASFPTVQYTATPGSGTMPSLKVLFISPGIDSSNHVLTGWNWDFGDGTSGSHQNELHTYTNAGVFAPILTATNDLGQLVFGVGPGISVTYPTVSFTETPASGVIPLAVNFSAPVVDSGGLTIESWSWNFGDGTNGADANTAHIYTVPGTYTPTLTVTNSAGYVLTATGSPIVVGTVVQNGGFETGDLSYWTTGGSYGYPNYDYVLGYPYAYSGNYGLAMNNGGSLGFILQNVTTTPGESYMLSCWLYCDGTATNEFYESWNGGVLLDITNMANVGWTNLQFQVSATAATTTVQFGFRNDYSTFGFDDVCLMPIVVALQSLPGANQTVNFTWNTVSNGIYQVQFTTNLALGNWSNLGAPIVAGSNSLSIAYPATNDQGYFRLLYQP
jgi:PKD repeat protein